MAAELAKDIKSERDLGALTQQLVKLTVETALNAVRIPANVTGHSGKVPEIGHDKTE
jgi:hypothetical protein